MRAGFGLIEIIVSIAISSIISLVLFTILFQLQKSEQRMTQTISADMRLILITERLQKDFSGMFWPQFKPKEAIKSKKQEANEPSDKSKAQEQAQEISGPNIAKIIFSENSVVGDLTLLKELSFITLNPLEVYGRVGSRVSRVIYSLAPQNEKADSFALYRQESLDLDYNLVKQQAPSYILIDGIRSLKLTYFYQDQQNNLDEQRELSLDQASNHEQNLNTRAQNKDSLLNRVPNYIKLDLSLWLSTEQKNMARYNDPEFKEFEFWFVLNNLVNEPDNISQANELDDSLGDPTKKNSENKNTQKTGAPKSGAKKI
jgi:prepilin-type N-terminal cleavage/methylation domain-containing protein